MSLSHNTPYQSLICVVIYELTSSSYYYLAVSLTYGVWDNGLAWNLVCISLSKVRLFNCYTLTCEGRKLATGPIMLLSSGDSYSSKGTNLKYSQISPIPLLTSPSIKKLEV